MTWRVPRGTRHDPAMGDELAAAVEPPEDRGRQVRRVLLAALPLPYLVVSCFVVTYLFEDHVGLQALVPLSLLGFPLTVVVAGVVGARAPTWPARARLWALTAVCAGLSCAVMGPTTDAATGLFARRTIASRADALRAFAHEPTRRVREGEVAGARDAPEVEGYVFDRAAFTPAGAWLLVRPASGIYWGWGVFVPYADVDPSQVGVGGALRPAWVSDLEPGPVPGLFHFRTPDGMSGGGGWALDRAYGER